MASRNSIKRAQFLISCQLCEEVKQIKWKCIDCRLLLCDNCKDNIHPKFKDSDAHKLIDIKEIGVKNEDNEISDTKCEEHDGQKYCLYCGTCKTFVCPLCISQTHNGHRLVPIDQSKVNENLTSLMPEIELTVNKTYTTNFPIVAHLVPTGVSTFMWISSGLQGLLWKMKVEENDLKEKLKFDIEIVDMAVTQSNSLLISTGKSVLQKISSRTGKLKDSKYNLEPFSTRALHVTKDDKIIVGVSIFYSETDRHAVIVMDKNGKQKNIYEHENDQNLFTDPYRITTTADGNICVIDIYNWTGRIVVLRQDGSLLNIYKGLEKENGFNPRGIVTTPSNNIIISDMMHHSIHILDHAGDFLTHVKTENFGISLPASMAFSTTGNFYIGCGTFKDNAKVYDIELIGC